MRAALRLERNAMTTPCPHPGLPDGHLLRSRATRQPAGRCAWWRLLPGLAAVLALGASAEEPWQVAGRQGLMQVVIVPTAVASDLAAYRAQIAVLCPGDRTCFVNFFTNSTGAPVALPLPDAISDEATARFRRSTKNGAELFQWSCRMKLGGECF